MAPLKNIAVQEIKDALSEIGSARDTYSGELATAMTGMQAEGYMPDSVDQADGDGASEAVAAGTEAAEYDSAQRALDQALVDSSGPMTPEKEAAATRLRDYATFQDPAADPAAIRLAGERLDDFQTAHLPPGSMPRDPILGADPQRRAMVRQEWQRQLEQGSPWMPSMMPDEATSWMNEQEAKARVDAIATVVKALEDQGMSQGAATDVVDAMSRGLSLSDLAASAGPLSELSQVDGALSDGRHSLPWERYSTADLKALAGVGKAFWAAGTVAEIAVAYDAYANGAAPGKTLGGLAGNLGGGAAGGWALGLAGGSVLGPGGAFVGAVVGGLLGSAGGKWAGSTVGSTFDN